MNPDPSFWLQFFGRLAVGGTALVGLGMLAARCGKSAAWPRAVWQACLTGLLLLLAFELTGAGQGLWRRGGADTVSPNARHVTGTTRTFHTTVSTVVPESTTLQASPQQQADATPASARASRRSAAWGPALVWMAGVTVLLLRGAFARALLAWRWRRRRAITDGPLWTRAQTIAHRLDLRSARLAEVEDLPGPVAHGLFPATVWLPKQFAARFTSAQQGAMLAHELAHVAARDPAWHVLADVVRALWWWHPLAWCGRR